MSRPAIYFNTYIKKPVARFIHGLDWQAMSVIVAMLLFVCQIIYNNIEKRNADKDSVYKLHVILQSEFENNFAVMSFGGISFSAIDEINACIPLPKNDAEATARIANAVSYLHDDVYKSQMTNLSLLPREDVLAVTKAYNAMLRLKNHIAAYQPDGNPIANMEKVKQLRNEYYHVYFAFAELNASFVKRLLSSASH